MEKGKIKLNDHFLAWAFIYAIAVFLSIQSTNLFNLQNSLGSIFLTGLIIVSFSQIISSLLYKKEFKLDKWFFIWFFTHSFNFWLVDLILRKLNLNYNNFLYFLAFGLIFHLFTWIINHRIYYKIKMNTPKTLILLLIFFGVLLFLSSQPFSQIHSIGFGENNLLNYSLSTLKNLVLSNLSPLNNCPQVDIPMLKSYDFGYYITEMKNLDMSQNMFFSDEEEFNYYTQRAFNNDTSDPQKGWKISVYSTTLLFGIRDNTIYCHKGNTKGENSNYFYCDSGFTGGIPYLSKTQMKPDGTIGETIRKSFINVYDSDKKFIKTLCGKPPEDIAEEDFKQTMREISNFFSLN